jgi:hypothetical protein
MTRFMRVIHVFLAAEKAWMARTSRAMTVKWVTFAQTKGKCDG